MVPAKLLLRSLLARPNPRAVLVLGNQKSGTTVIAQLLAKATRQSYSHDMLFRWNWNCVEDLHQGRYPIDRFVRGAAFEFSKGIIKDPDFTFLYDGLRRRFPDGRFVFVIRDPARNIRSLLNRHNFPGRVEDLAESDALVATLSPLWKTVFTHQSLGLSRGDYIEVLAQRWNRCAGIYFGDANRFILLRYETFLKDKVGAIGALAEQLGLPVVADISKEVDRQFQPKGDHSQTLEQFFGSNNMAKIKRWCGSRAERLGYGI